MGCSSSYTNDDSNLRFEKSSLENLSSLKEKFLLRHKAISELRSNNKLFDDEYKLIFSLDHERFEEQYESFYVRNKGLLDPKLFTKESFKEFTLTFASQSFIISDFHYQNYNIKDLIVSFVKELKNEPEFNESDIMMVEDLLNSVTDKFPPIQKGFIYSPESIKSHCFAHGQINNNFKYTSDFEVNVLNFVLIGEHIDNIGYLTGIAEIIEANKKLVSVCMQLYDNYDDNKPFEKSKMKNINIIIDAIQNNRNIKAFAILQSKGERSLELGDEVIDKLSELMKKDFLYFIYLYRLSFNRDFGKKVGSILPSLANLNFFGIFSDDDDFEYLTDIFQGISKNSSLVLTITQKYIIPETKLSELKSLAMSCKTLRLFKNFKMTHF